VIGSPFGGRQSWGFFFLSLRIRIIMGDGACRLLGWNDIKSSGEGSFEKKKGGGGRVFLSRPKAGKLTFEKILRGKKSL